jgi:2,4-dichlorophenol 6-monooxygenase
MPEDRTTVLICGGGGCGLAAAVMLADLGVPYLLVERHPTTAVMPKAHILNVRTMEIFAQHGLADRVYRLGAPQEANSTCRWYTSLGGERSWDDRELFRVDAWGGGSLREHYRGLSAYRHGNVPQILLEPLLREVALERGGGEIRFNHELSGFDQDPDGVTATIRDRETDGESTVRADFLIGADGGKTVGPALGVRLEGPDPFVETVSVYFRADLSPYLSNDDSLIRLFLRPELDGGWTRTGCVAHGPKHWDRHCEEWAVSVTLRPEQLAAEFDPAAAAAAVRERLNLPELELEVLRTSRWKIESVLAERYRVGRVFLAGDAAHRHSPMGGLGLNTGIQDAHNLTWKLAAVAAGAATEELLDSYEAERRPVGRRNVDFATFAFFNHLAAAAGFGLMPGAPAAHNAAALEALFADTDDGATRRARLDGYFATLRMEFQCADIDLGFEYADGPAVVADGTAAPPRDPVGFEYVPTARPGHRLPHAWLERFGTHLGTHELLRPGRFLVLAGDAGEAWCVAAEDLAAAGVAIDAWRIGPGAELRDRYGEWAAVRGHGEDGAVLVRPDGHVAFRAASAHPDAPAALREALAQIDFDPATPADRRVRNR